MYLILMLFLKKYKFALKNYKEILKIFQFFYLPTVTLLQYE